MSPTQRSLAFCRRRGMTAQVVERWNPYARVRHDLFGCIDIVACVAPGFAPPGIRNGILGIQACAAASHAARRAKAMAEPRLRQWLDAGGQFEIWSWGKKGARGKRKLWELRREALV